MLANMTFTKLKFIALKMTILATLFTLVTNHERSWSVMVTFRLTMILFPGNQKLVMMRV